jgi:hypothetical protein
MLFSPPTFLFNFMLKKYITEGAEYSWYRWNIYKLLHEYSTEFWILYGRVYWGDRRVVWWQYSNRIKKFRYTFPVRKDYLCQFLSKGNYNREQIKTAMYNVLHSFLVCYLLSRVVCHAWAKHVPAESEVLLDSNYSCNILA